MESSTSLHAYADIVGYSRLNAALQAESQERLVRLLDSSMRDAGVSPDSVIKQDEGDARLLTFPVATDIARVLAVMPRSLGAELRERNKAAAPHAQLRLRLSYVVGPSAPGVTGQTGNSPVAAVRICNAAPLRDAMGGAPDVCLGMIVDEFVYRWYVEQGFRADLEPGEFRRVHVSEKGFQTDAWVRLIGGRPGQRPRKRASAARTRLPAGGTRPPGPDQEPPPARPRRRWRLNDVNSRIIAAVIVGVLGLIGVSLTLIPHGSNGRDPRTGPTAGRTSSPATSSLRSGVNAPAGGGRSAPATVTEYGDWGPGVAAYSSNFGAASNAPDIPLNWAVEVSCSAPNKSGIQSINEFYLLASGPWKGTYASANEFTNGGPRDTASDPSKDPRVRPCPA